MVRSYLKHILNYVLRFQELGNKVNRGNDKTKKGAHSPARPMWTLWPGSLPLGTQAEFPGRGSEKTRASYLFLSLHSFHPVKLPQGKDEITWCT